MVKWEIRYRIFIKKVLIFFAGFITILILLELSLRLTGYIHLKNYHKESAGDIKDCTILCIGDSYTEGLGAVSGLGYPEQLENMLNKNSRIKFKIINRGISNQNTSQILKRIPDELNNQNFSLAVILAGGANQWNFEGYDNNSVNNFLYNFKVYKLITLLYNDVVEKQGMKKNQLNSPGLNEKKSLLSINKFKENVIKNPSNSDNFYNLGTYYLYEKKDYNEASKWFKSGIKSNFKDRKNYEGLRNTLDYSGNREEFINFIYGEIFRNPVNLNYWYCLSTFNQSELNDSLLILLFGKYTQSLKGKIISDVILSYPAIIYAYDLLRDKTLPSTFAAEELGKDKDNLILNYINGFISEKQGHSTAAANYYNNAILIFKNFISNDGNISLDYYRLFYENFHEHDNIFTRFILRTPEYRSYLNKQNTFPENGNSNIISQWTKSDLIKIINYFESAGIKVIIMNYPVHYQLAPENNANKVIYEIVQENPGFNFIDNFYFFELLTNNKNDFFEKNGSHPNEKGYKIIAENICKKILQGNIISVSKKTPNFLFI
jgi:lysophospholipase L1-like esterase